MFKHSRLLASPSIPDCWHFQAFLTAGMSKHSWLLACPSIPGCWHVHAFLTAGMSKHSRLLACPSIPGCWHVQALLSRLQSVLRAATRRMLRKLKYDSISAGIRDRLHWLPRKQRIEFKICVLVSKCRLNKALVYLSEMLHAVQRQTKYNLRSDTRLNYDVPRCSSVCSGPHSFAVSGPTLWNSLPNSLKECMSLSVFKTGIKTWLFKRAFG